MERYFNITGCCNPGEHYMVNLDSRLAQIKKMIDRGQYFCINRGRQYGKTTMLKALCNYLSDDYFVISMDFQKDMSSLDYEKENYFCVSFGHIFGDALKKLKVKNTESINSMMEQMQFWGERFGFVRLFQGISKICLSSEKPIVLIIDEVDSASNNQVFLDFLAQLRGYYLERNEQPTFQSVILAGVHDIRNLRQKIRPDAEHKHNSPWNIASSFDVDMSFNVSDIAGMLEDYEKDHHTGMDIIGISQLIYDYTSGYPVLVSTICKYLDEKSGWTIQNLNEAVKHITVQRSPLFESLINKLEDDSELKNLLYGVLFYGQKFIYNAYDSAIHTASMYGFVKNDNGSVAISNRIFEITIYDWFISQEATKSRIFPKVQMTKTSSLQAISLIWRKSLKNSSCISMIFTEISLINSRKKMEGSCFCFISVQ